MATDLTNLTGFSYVNLGFQATRADGLGSATDVVNIQEKNAASFADGDNQMWHDRRTLAAAADEDLELDALLTFSGYATGFTSIQQVYIKNSTTAAELAVYFRVTTANAQATWDATDVVRNKTGAGDDWTGTIHSVIDTTHFVIALVTGAYADVAIADDIENTTHASDDTFTKAAEAGATLRIGASAGGDPVDIWLGTTETEDLKYGEISFHVGDWTVGAGADNDLFVENIGVIPAKYDIMVVGKVTP